MIVPWGRRWALLLARLILGFIFFMAGWWKVFHLGPVEHARKLFVEPYANSILPAWSLWSMGVVIPVVELLAGAGVLLGWRRRASYLALAAVLVIVTFGHLLAEPLYEFHTHVIPRAGLLLVLLSCRLEEDEFSLDEALTRRQRSVARQEGHA